MGVLDRLIAGSLYAGTPAPDADFWYRDVGPMTAAGMRIDEDGARKLSAWYRGRDLLSTALAMLPLQVFERLPEDQGAEMARTHPLYDVLHRKPNDWQNSYEYRRLAMGHLIDAGNHYSRIIGGRRGFADQLHPLDPRKVRPEQVASGRVLYHVTTKTGQVETFGQDEILHLRGQSDDGIVGKGVLEWACDSLGTASAVESYAAKAFGKGTLNGGTVSVQGTMTDEASARMAKSFVTSAGDWHLPKILEQGATWAQSDITPEDFQMILSRKFSVNDIARWLGLPPHMLADLDRSTNNNIEHQGQEFVTYSLGPWLSLWEFACNDQLILNTSRFYVEFTRDALVRGDLAARWAAYQIAISTGTFTRNEVRRSENRPALEGLDEPLDPAHLTGKQSEGQSNNQPPPPAKGKPVPPAEDDDQQARAVMVGAAARLLRKEVKAVLAAAVKSASDADRFAVLVTDFYAKHAALVAETLLMPLPMAESYCAGQAAQVLGEIGVRAVEGWDDTYAAGLAAWASEREVA